MLTDFPSSRSIKTTFFHDMKLPLPALWHKWNDLPETTQEICSREIHCPSISIKAVTIELSHLFPK